MTSIDQTLEDYHFTFSNKAGYYPIAGIVPGALKAIAGLAETIAAVASSLFLTLPSVVSEQARENLTWSISHIPSGLKRAFIGTFLAIPFIGTAVLAGVYAIGGFAEFGSDYFVGVFSGTRKSFETSSFAKIVLS